MAALAALRETAFSNVVILFRGLDEVGNKAFAEWVIEADHTGPLVLGEDAVLEATGRQVQLAGATVADFRDGKIRSYPDVLRRPLSDRADRRRLTAAVEFQVEGNPDPLDIEFLEAQIRREASAAMGSATRSSWRSSCATATRSSPVSAAGPGATAASCRASGWSRVPGPRTRDPASRRCRSRGGGAWLHTDRPLHLRLSGSSPLRAERLRTGRASGGLPIGNGRPLVPQAPELDRSPRP